MTQRAATTRFFNCQLHSTCEVGTRNLPDTSTWHRSDLIHHCSEDESLLPWDDADGAEDPELL
jgi:hypothetical protein